MRCQQEPVSSLEEGGRDDLDMKKYTVITIKQKGNVIEKLSSDKFSPNSELLMIYEIIITPKVQWP